MAHKIINNEQFEFWNKGIGQKWVDEDQSMNERLSILTEELFLKSNIKKDDKVLDIGCGGGQTSFEASKLVGTNGYVVGADISKILLELAERKYSQIKNLEFISYKLNFDILDLKIITEPSKKKTIFAVMKVRKNVR